MVVDWERERFNLSQAVFEAPMPEPGIITIEPKLSRTESLDAESTGKLAAGAIAGIAIGAAIILAGILAGLWFWRRRQRSEKAARYPGALQAMDGFDEDEKKVANDMGLEEHRAADIELEGDQHHAVEMDAPRKTHEMAPGKGEDVRMDPKPQSNLYEMPDTSRGQA